jgi:Flp pilus assembly protein TadD
MRRDLHLACSLLAAGSLMLAGGCASPFTRGESSSWLKLPSPRSTIKQAGRDAPASQTAGKQRPTSSKPAPEAKTASKSKPKNGKEEESVAMSILRGRNYERTAEWDKARPVYEELREKHPDNVEVAYRLGIVADAQRRYAEAEQLFLFALQREPRNAAILADLGYCYYLQGQLTKAESALLKATALEPTNTRYSNNLALVMGHQGRYEEALDELRKSGSEADAQYNLAFVYASQDKADLSKAAFQEALAADPTHRRSREALASFEEYERMPPYLREMESFTDHGVRYVPYIEGATNDGAIATAGGQESVATGYNASQATRQLRSESRGMLNRNMASQRSEDAEGN